MHAETNYIYIALAVLYVIYSIVKAAKKNSAKPPPAKKTGPADTVPPPASSPVPQPENDLKKMLEEVFGSTEEPEPVQKQPPPEPVKIKPPPVKEITYPKKRERAALSHMPRKSKEKADPVPAVQAETTKKSFSGPVVQEDPEEETNEDFDIRQAIIYSEILKRPDW